MYINIDEWIGNLVLFLFGIGAFTLVLWSFPRIGYHFDKSTCSITVDSKEVYCGKCHFTDITPVGEYGNSKKVIIFKDISRWYPKQVYISDKVEVRECMH